MIKKLLVYYSFIVVSLIVFLGFLGAENYYQLISAILFYPLFVYFVLKILPKRNRAITLPVEAKPVTKKGRAPSKSTETKVEVLKQEKGGLDIDRRAFLKLIGSAGASVFLFSVFTKKAEAAFFGSVPGPGTVAIKDSSGNQIDPAIKHPTDGYKISRLDDSSPAYYGFTDKDGAWFIMKEDSSGNYTYDVGASSFGTNWTDRGNLSYGEYFDKF